MVPWYELSCRLDLVNVVVHRQDIHGHIHVHHCIMKVSRILVRAEMREN